VRVTEPNASPPGSFPTQFLITAVIFDAGLLVIVAAYVYSVEMMYRTGQTIGKRVTKSTSRVLWSRC
jgi:hypothetical protein